MFRALIHDRLVQLLLLTFAVANVLPLDGHYLDVARILSNATIFLLFLLNGIRLPRDEVIAGIRHWRLQGAIMFWVFGAMTLACFAISQLMSTWLPHRLVLGIILLGALPTTVQSATAYCSIAKGNLAASVVASALINLIGVILTPLLFAFFASSTGANFSPDTLVRILTILLLPFVIGQLIQKWTLPTVSRNPGIFRFADRFVVLLAVYVALSGAVSNGLWAQLSTEALLVMLFAIGLLLAFAFGGAWLLGSKAGFDWPDRKTMLFSGAQKSIAIGAPLAAIMFSPADAGFILLPVLLYHLLQMVVSAPLAGMLAAK